MFVHFSELSDGDQKRFHPTHEYVTGFLTAAHPYRKGSVCPFVQGADERGLIRYVVVSSPMWRIEKQVSAALEFQCQKNEGGAVILLFSPQRKSWVLSWVRRRMRVSALRSGQLLGSFGPDDDSPSLHGKDFFPLRTPQPIMVIRNIVQSDLALFKDPVIKKQERIEFLEWYIAKFEGVRGSRQQEVLEAKMLLATLR